MIPLETAVDAAKAMKEADWEDVMPMLHVEFEDQTTTLVGMPEFAGGDEGVFMLGAVLVRLRVEMGPIESLVFTNDARMRTLESGQNRPPNDVLEDKWKAGDRDGITECLLVHHVTQDGYTHVNLPYDADARTWGEQVVAEQNGEYQVGGRIVDTLRLAGFSTQPDGSVDLHLDDLIEKERNA